MEHWAAGGRTKKFEGPPRLGHTRGMKLRTRTVGRAALAVLAIVALSAAASACSSGGDPPEAAGFSDRFAMYEPAPEPNGDLSKVVWPDFVTRADPEVKALYEFNIANGDLMRYMPCFCGCGDDGHRNNRDCYVRKVNTDGSVVLDSMAPT